MGDGCIWYGPVDEPEYETVFGPATPLPAAQMVHPDPWNFGSAADEGEGVAGEGGRHARAHSPGHLHHQHRCLGRDGEVVADAADV